MRGIFLLAVVVVTTASLFVIHTKNSVANATVVAAVVVAVAAVIIVMAVVVVCVVCVVGVADVAVVWAR